MKIINFEPHHYLEMQMQEHQKDFAFLQTEEFAYKIKQWPSWSCEHKGIIIACGCIIPFWKGRAEAVIFIDKRIKSRDFLLFFRQVKDIMDRYDVKRLEATIRHNWSEGHRWIKCLGFKKECSMKVWGPNEETYDLYSRIKI